MRQEALSYINLLLRSKMNFHWAQGRHVYSHADSMVQNSWLLGAFPEQIQSWNGHGHGTVMVMEQVTSYDSHDDSNVTYREFGTVCSVWVVRPLLGGWVRECVGAWVHGCTGGSSPSSVCRGA